MDIKKRTLSTAEEAVLLNDVTDIQNWVDGAITGKIENCKKRMIIHWQPILNADSDVESIPADDDKLIALIIARDDYKTRVERDADVPT
jgi:hypothetical protein